MSYKILKDGKTVTSRKKGRYTGHRPKKIFGRLDCESGKQKMLPKNRVFFLTWQDAIDARYRPCKLCKPTPEDTYAKTRR